jgi:hypothetical protein
MEQDPIHQLVLRALRGSECSGAGPVLFIRSAASQSGPLYSPTLPSVHWFNIECSDLFLDAVLEFFAGGVK